MVKHSDQSAGRGSLPAVVLIGGGFFLFLLLMYLFWFDQRPDTVAFGGTPPEERVERLRELRQREREVLTQYGWVDREQGIVRLPIDRAMELFVAETNQSQTQN